LGKEELAEFSRRLAMLSVPGVESVYDGLQRLLGFRLASGGAEGRRHSRTESHHDSVECAVAGISSSTLPSARAQDFAGSQSINWLYLLDHGIELCQGHSDFAGGSPGSGEHRQGSAKTFGICDGEFVSRLRVPNTSSSKVAWALKMQPCPATGPQFV